jgi:2,3-bisphosphoglycerate-dependent phosphoglycerate mutase
VVPTWRLNERHYGALQGLNKVDTAAEFGQAQVMIWRRSYRTPPPALDPSDPRCERGDRRYAKLEPQQIPLTECLHDTVERVLPFWYDTIVPAIMGGQRVVVVAHGNSIRALMKHLENISEADIVELNIPNAVPVVYDLDASMRPIGRRFLEAQPT